MQAGGTPDLLSAVYSIQIKNEEKISEVAEEELLARFLKAANPGRWSKVFPEPKGDKIIFPNMLYYEDYSWQKEEHLSSSSYGTLADICAGIIFGAIDSLSGGSNYLAGYDCRDVDFSRWYDIISASLSVKFYKNGRIDFKFPNKESADRCYKKIGLDTLKPLPEDK